MNLLTWITPKRYDYNLLAGDNDGKGSSTQTSTGYGFRDLLVKTALVCLLVVSSFFAGRLSRSVSSTGREKAFGLETEDQLFQYNRTFGEAPSNATDAAWRSLFPQHGGFFVHPELAPKRSAFSVFHQMHCLDELRHGFYVLHDQVITYSEMIGDHQATGASHQAERELKNEELGGVTGFGTVHRCVDWPGLLEWIRPYEGTDAPPISQEHDHTG
ncbi:putative Oxidase ustYa [Seiridium cardinale]